jgi:ribonuclease HI
MENTLENSMWLIGDGTRVFYWTDNWLGVPLLDALAIPHISPLDTKVSDLILDKEWVIPPLLFELAPWLVEEVRGVTLPLEPLEDCFVWKHSKDGFLSAKDAYLHLNKPGLVLHWAELIWQNFIPPSHSFVAWRLILNKLPTDENLRARGCTIVSACPLCLTDNDSSFHLFLHCPFALALWNWMNITFNVTVDLSSPTSLILGCSAFHAQLNDLLLAGIIHTLHTLWLARNGVLFSNAKISVHAATTKVRTAIKLSSSLMHSLTKPGSADITILQRLDVTPSYPRPVSLIPVSWKAPMAPWTKVNTDGSVIDTATACGAIFRDFMGAYKGGFSSKLEHSTVLHAELMGIILAMEMALEKGWLRLWVESDSQVAVRASKDHSIVPWNLQNRWHNCLSCQMQLLFSHVYREGNSCADKLAAHGHVITGFLWWDVIPPFIYHDFFFDRIGFTYFRET